MLNGSLFPLGRIDLNLRDYPGKKERKKKIMENKTDLALTALA